jgi:hypothetical protein
VARDGTSFAMAKVTSILQSSGDTGHRTDQNILFFVYFFGESGAIDMHILSVRKQAESPHYLVLHGLLTQHTEAEVLPGNIVLIQ